MIWIIYIKIIVGIIKTLKNNENANNIPQGGNAGGPMPYPTHAQIYQAAHQPQPQPVVNNPAPVMPQYQAPVNQAAPAQKANEPVGSEKDDLGVPAYLRRKK